MTPYVLVWGRPWIWFWTCGVCGAFGMSQLRGRSMLEENMGVLCGTSGLAAFCQIRLEGRLWSALGGGGHPLPAEGDHGRW